MILAVGEVIDNVKNGIDLWYAFIVGLPALVAAGVGVYGQSKAKRRWDNQESVNQQTLDQVKNSHNENLRDEITRGFREVREDIRALRYELHVERQERIDGDKREIA